MKLVLFDIDGTIFWSDGAGRRAMTEALTNVFGGAGPTDYHYDGKTDPQIVRDLMRASGHTDETIDERIAPLWSTISAVSSASSPAARAPTCSTACASCWTQLEARGDIVLGLLTGNLREGAAIKLQAAGIDIDRFRVCAFGSDHHARGELPALAQRRRRKRSAWTFRATTSSSSATRRRTSTCGRGDRRARDRRRHGTLHARGARAAPPVRALLFARRHGGGDACDRRCVRWSSRRCSIRGAIGSARLERAGATRVFSGRIEDRRYDTPERCARRARHRAAAAHLPRFETARARSSSTRARPRTRSGYKVRDEVGSTVSGSGGRSRTYSPGSATRSRARSIATSSSGMSQGASVRFERYPRMDDLVEVEGEPETIERAIAALGISRSAYTAERLTDFAFATRRERESAPRCRTRSSAPTRRGSRALSVALQLTAPRRARRTAARARARRRSDGLARRRLRSLSIPRAGASRSRSRSWRAFAFPATCSSCTSTPVM